MCGIVGIINTNQQPHYQLSTWLNTMSRAIQHRGPDGVGFVFFDKKNRPHPTTTSTFYNKNKQSAINYHPETPIQTLKNTAFQIGLGHQRLSIIDTSMAGHQPMATPDGQLWLTYNGEIYNYIELRKTLQQYGYVFRTQTDTEVILNAYLHWGRACIQYFNGMFAFVLYDRKRQLIWGVRDRTGVKPLYYYHNKEYIAFASEQKALLQLPFVDKKINPTAAFDYFVLNTLEAQPQGLFEDIQELPPSHDFTIDLTTKTVQTHRYFQFQPKPFTTKNRFDEATFQTLTTTTRQLVQQAIKIRLRSDVAIGSCLSGGLDSSTIVCVINQLLRQEKIAQIGERQQVFTTCFKDKRYDEQAWAKLVVDQTQATWHKTFPTQNELLDDLETLIYCQDIPMYSTSTYAQFRVMQLIKAAGIKVVLDGQGGDELFGGYAPHYVGLWNELLQHFQFNALAKELKFFGGYGKAFKFWLKNQLKYNGLSKLPTRWRHRFQLQYFNELHYLNPDLLASQQFRYQEFISEKVNSLKNMLTYEYFKTPLKQLLKCEDRCSMWFGIESRTPFADDLPLMEMVLSVPAHFKIHKSIRKYLLREAFKGILPEPIRQRQDKMGFVTPNNQWIKNLRHHIRPYFEEQDTLIFNKKRLLADFDRFFNPNTTIENYRIFKFISFAIWRKVFEV